MDRTAIRSRQRYLALVARKRGDGKIVTPKTPDDRLADKLNTLLARRTEAK